MTLPGPMVPPWWAPGMADSGTAKPGLDDTSRATLRGFGVRLLAMLALTLAPPAVGMVPLATAWPALSLLCALACILQLGLALRSGQAVGEGPLNHWDEALAIAAVSRLIHLL